MCVNATLAGDTVECKLRLIFYYYFWQTFCRRAFEHGEERSGMDGSVSSDDCSVVKLTKFTFTCGSGFGTQMSNNPMVILWSNPDGSTTLSQRIARSWVMPEVVDNPPRIATLSSDLSTVCLCLCVVYSMFLISSFAVFRE